MRERVCGWEEKWVMDINILHELPLLVSDTLLAYSAHCPSSVDLLGLSVPRMFGVCTAWSCLWKCTGISPKSPIALACQPETSFYA